MPLFFYMHTEYSSHWHPADATPAYGNWRINGNDNMVLSIQSIIHLCNQNNLLLIDHRDIAWKGKHHYPLWNGSNCPCCNGQRYQSCDIRYPGIITNGPNPYGNPYRMLDGKHRMQKLMFLGITRSRFYVLEWNEVLPYFLEAPWKKTNSN